MGIPEWTKSLVVQIILEKTHKLQHFREIIKLLTSSQVLSAIVIFPPNSMYMFTNQFDFIYLKLYSGIY